MDCVPDTMEMPREPFRSLPRDLGNHVMKSSSLASPLLIKLERSLALSSPLAQSPGTCDSQCKHLMPLECALQKCLCMSKHLALSLTLGLVFCANLYLLLRLHDAMLISFLFNYCMKLLFSQPTLLSWKVSILRATLATRIAVFRNSFLLKHRRRCRFVMTELCLTITSNQEAALWTYQ
jgi:hypothetical protein